jgi:predicted flavoprotein YhiN
MESKIVPNLYFAGEVIDIDGLTGGYNFQSAWSTAYLVGKSIFLNK